MAVKTSGAPAPNLFTPKADSAEGEKVNQDYQGAKQTFQEKVNSPKSEQAIKKDTGMSKNEHLEKLQNDHVNAIGKLNQADKSKKDAQNEAQSDPYAAEVVGDGKGGQPGGGAEDNLIKNISQNFGGKAPGGMGGINQNMSAIKKPDDKNNMSQIGGPGAGFNRRGGGMSAGSSNDPGALMGMLGQKRADAGDMRGQMEGLGSQQDGLMGVGQKQAGAADRFGGLKNAFGNKAVMHGDLQKAYGDAGKGLKSASKGLGNASQVLQGVSQALKGAAAAVAAIPFVGPALSAALKTAATIVGVVGQALKGASQKTGQSGDKMNNKSADEGQQKQVNTAKKVANEAKETQAKDDVKKTQKQVDGITGSKNEAQNDLKSNVSEQKDLAKKIEENGGGKVAIDSQDDNAAERPQIKLDDKAKNQKKAKGGAPSSGTPASPAGQPAAAQPAAAPAAGKGADTSAPGAAAPVGGAAPAKAPSAAPAPSQSAALAPAPANPVSEVKPAQQNPKAKNDKEQEKNAEVKEASQNPGKPAAKPLGARPQQKKPEQKVGANKAVEQGQEVVGGGDAKRQRYEAELRQLADRVNTSKSGGDQAHSRRDAQRQLANVYKDAASNNVSVSAEVEKKASAALKDSPERVSVRLRTVEEMGDSNAQGGGGFGQKKPFQLGDKNNNLQRGGLQIPKLAAPNFLAMSGQNGQQPQANHFAPAQNSEAVQPVHKMAS